MPGESAHRAYALDICTLTNEQTKANSVMLRVTEHSSLSPVVEAMVDLPFGDETRRSGRVSCPLVSH